LLKPAMGSVIDLTPFFLVPLVFQNAPFRFVSSQGNQDQTCSKISDKLSQAQALNMTIVSS
jgi:hypothetical protein